MASHCRQQPPIVVICLLGCKYTGGPTLPPVVSPPLLLASSRRRWQNPIVTRGFLLLLVASRCYWSPPVVAGGPLSPGPARRRQTYGNCPQRQVCPRQSWVSLPGALRHCWCSGALQGPVRRKRKEKHTPGPERCYPRALPRYACCFLPYSCPRSDPVPCSLLFPCPRHFCCSRLSSLRSSIFRQETLVLCLERGREWVGVDALMRDKWSSISRSSSTFNRHVTDHVTS
jgi:hypothetical protein